MNKQVLRILEIPFSGHYRVILLHHSSKISTEVKKTYGYYLKVAKNNEEYFNVLHSLAAILNFVNKKMSPRVPTLHPVDIYSI